MLWRNAARSRLPITRRCTRFASICKTRLSPPPGAISVHPLRPSGYRHAGKSWPSVPRRWPTTPITKTTTLPRSGCMQDSGRPAADAVARIESWRRIPAPLAWMLQARLALQGLQPNWGLLAELAWLSPSRLELVLSHRSDPLLVPLLARFGQTFEGAGDATDLAWFPAWVLTERPNLAPQLAQAQASLHRAPEQAMRLMLELLGLEHQGRHHDVIDRRKTLRGLHASLYAAYMASR